MKFFELPLAGAFVVEPELITDERGFFARTFSPEEFAARGLETDLSQCSISFNRQAGTLRGMHFQNAPHEEAKLVRCSMGAIRDVVLDLRRDSPTFKRWAAVELSAENRKALYIPRGLAHGFLTLTQNAEVFYQISPTYRPEAAAGVRWNDPTFGIQWGEDPVVMSERDRTYPDFAP